MKAFNSGATYKKTPERACSFVTYMAQVKANHQEISKWWNLDDTKNFQCDRSMLDGTIFLRETVLDEAMMLLFTPECHSIDSKLNALVSISVLQGMN